MTIDEKIEKLKAANWATDTPELKRYAQDVIDNANRRIRTANKRETRGQELVYQSSPMRRIREEGDKYYLPKGRFTITGLKTDEAKRNAIKNAAGFLGLKTTTQKGAKERDQQLRREMKAASTKARREKLEKDMPIVGTKGPAAGRRIVGKPKREFFRSSQEFQNALATYNLKKDEAQKAAKEADDRILSMSYQEVSDFYDLYRRFLERAWGSAKVFERKLFRDYNTLENSAGGILQKLAELNIDPLDPNWPSKMAAKVQKMRKINALKGSIGEASDVDPVAEGVAEPSYKAPIPPNPKLRNRNFKK